MTESDQTGTDTTITLYELINQISIAELDIQQEDGAFPPSKSGVYNRPETPVRSTAQWLNILLFSYGQTGEEKISEAANMAANYLMSRESRPEGETFHARRDGKDQCDGLVGQASPIQSLARAGRVLNRPELLMTAIEVFTLHPFDRNLGLWEAVDINGDRLSFDRTLNHQIIFASASTDLIDYSRLAKNRIIRFLDRLGDNIQTRSNGRIRHYVRPPTLTSLPIVARYPRHWPLLWNEIAARYYSLSRERYQKELGYHPTVLAALSTLKRQFPSHDIWSHDHIQTALSFTKSKTYRDQVQNRSSEYGSMLPGINHAKILYAFDDACPDKLRPLVQSDIDRTYDSDTGLLTRNAVDPVFQSFSIEAATDLPDMEIQIPNEPNSKSY